MYKEYVHLLLIEFLLWFMLLLAWRIQGGAVWFTAAAVLLCVIGATVFFFRNPERKVPVADHVVLAPADGKILKIQNHEEKRFCHCRVNTISIFLRLWDVHVNRVPVSGTVEFKEYGKGLFHAAMSDKASLDNEQMQIGIVHPQGRFLIRQIAGIIARRIVCHVQKGDQVRQGDRFGMIKFGSRVEVSLPEKYTILVHEKQRVKAGETIIGKLENQ